MSLYSERFGMSACALLWGVESSDGELAAQNESSDRSTGAPLPPVPLWAECDDPTLVLSGPLPPPPLPGVSRCCACSMLMNPPKRSWFDEPGGPPWMPRLGLRLKSSPISPAASPVPRMLSARPRPPMCAFALGAITSGSSSPNPLGGAAMPERVDGVNMPPFISGVGSPATTPVISGVRSMPSASSPTATGLPWASSLVTWPMCSRMLGSGGPATRTGASPPLSSPNRLAMRWKPSLGWYTSVSLFTRGRPAPRGGRPAFMLGAVSDWTLLPALPTPIGMYGLVEYPCIIGFEGVIVGDGIASGPTFDMPLFDIYPRSSSCCFSSISWFLRLRPGRPGRPGPGLPSLPPLLLPLLLLLLLLPPLPPPMCDE
eukprot:comp5097_c0_seq1/m.4196 comp5097_c0_seq1/g.4196  ORF comp5097_c0_seq1/g.4196 comp5097_c0_seq1/m.4196 type:complete len:372 (-) comp5097_c0_seq1:159-1274(-)